MRTSSTARVLVATSGSETSRSAITYAAREAAARGLPLELVHVTMPEIATGPYGVTGEPDLLLAGRALLAKGEELARTTAPHLAATSTMLVGSRPDAVVRHAEGAHLVVVGAPPPDLMGRIWTGSTVMGIAARATCPVVVVPEHASPGGTPEVLVGLKSTRHCQHLLAAAFAIARQTQSDLRIVHAWHMVSPYDEAVAGRAATPSWEQHELTAIEGELVDLRMVYPDVQVRIALEHGKPAEVLLAAARSATLVVISRPKHGGCFHHLGSTARAVIRESVCPVMVVPPSDEDVGSEHRDADAVLAP